MSCTATTTGSGLHLEDWACSICPIGKGLSANQSTLPNTAPDSGKSCGAFSFLGLLDQSLGGQPKDTALQGRRLPPEMEKEKIDTGILRLSGEPGQAGAAKASKKPE